MTNTAGVSCLVREHVFCAERHVADVDASASGEVSPTLGARLDEERRLRESSG